MRGKWWQEAVIYEIYPRSFYDANGDGIGDLQGIIQKLDYLKDLGVTAIWICPFYRSPMDDNGYDVSDFYSVAEEYGTMDDLKALIAELHKRDMKLIVDLVLNHTSDEHPWFIESRKSVDNPYRDFYIWRKGNNGQPPTNWESFFGGSVWEYDETTGYYYMHIFSKKMPDLNWRNPKLRQEMYQMINWYLELGVDGFRVDAVAHLSKNWEFPNHEPIPGKEYVACYHEFSNRPEVHDYIREMNAHTMNRYPDVVTIGEAGGASLEDTLKYCAYDRNEFHMLIQFDHCWLDTDPSSAPYVPDKWTWKALDLRDLKRSFKKYQQGLYGKVWNTIYWSNHDQPRILSHYGTEGEQWEVCGKMLATVLYMQGGTPIIYQGEEIGMMNVKFEHLTDYRDVEIFTLYEETVGKGLASHEEMMERIHRRSRDNARTPMQWSDEPYAGFSTSEPWIKVNPNYKQINVEEQLKREDSLLNYYKKLFRIRQSTPTLIYGDFKLYLEHDENVVLYTRSDKEETYMILCNFFDRHVTVEIPEDIEVQNVTLILSNIRDCALQRQMHLLPYEALVYRLNA